MFLENATRDQLVQAVASNHRWWMVRNAHAGGGEVRSENGALWVYCPWDEGELSVAFPRLTRSNAGEQIDRIVDFYRDQDSSGGVNFWSLDPPSPRDLGARLAARGFEWSWRPHWMCLDLRKMMADLPGPPSISIEAAEDSSVWEVSDLPYYNPSSARRIQSAVNERPRRVWRFVARQDGRVVGHVTLHVTHGKLGIAGIYSLGVVPSARGQGIGTALTVRACRAAQSIGCGYALLNSTPQGEGVYRVVGFESLGYGQTWYLSQRALASDPPGREEVAFAEAMGRGDLPALDAISASASFKARDLEVPFLCGLTPIQLAARTHQPASAEWLLRNGSMLDVMSAWNLGWKDRVNELLKQNPDLANQRIGDMRTAPMHEAVHRDDIELAQTLLTACPDLTLKDAQFNSTPLGWAEHLGRSELAELLRSYTASRA